MEKHEHPIKSLVHWYFGNYCTRKCFDNDEKLHDHYTKLINFAEKNPQLRMTHHDFLWLFSNEMKICTLEDSFKRKMIGWKLFERLKDTPNYDSDKIIVENNVVKKRDGDLDKPVRCSVCKALGVC